MGSVELSCLKGFKFGPVLESAASAAAAAVTLESATTTSSFDESGFAAGLATSRALIEKAFSKFKQKRNVRRRSKNKN